MNQTNDIHASSLKGNPCAKSWSSKFLDMTRVFYLSYCLPLNENKFSDSVTSCLLKQALSR